MDSKKNTEELEGIILIEFGTAAQQFPSVSEFCHDMIKSTQNGSWKIRKCMLIKISMKLKIKLMKWRGCRILRNRMTPKWVPVKAIICGPGCPGPVNGVDTIEYRNKFLLNISVNQ